MDARVGVPEALNKERNVGALIMQNQMSFTRRRVLAASGAAGGAALLAACVNATSSAPSASVQPATLI